MWVRDLTDCVDGNLGGSANPFGETNLIAGACWDGNSRLNATRRRVDEVGAGFVRPRGDPFNVLRLKPFRCPVGRAHAEKDGNAVAGNLSNRSNDPQQQSGAIFERPAVIVGPVVGDRGQELVEKVAVGRVNLEDVEARAERAPSGASPILDGGVNPGGVECDGWLVVAER